MVVLLFEAADLIGCNAPSLMGAVRPPVDSERNGAHVASVVPFRCACLPSVCAEELLWKEGSSECKTQGGTCTSPPPPLVQPLLLGRCRIHAPPLPPLTAFVSGVRACHASHQGKGEGTAFTITSLLSLSSFGCCGRCKLPRLHVEFAPLSSIYLHLCTQRHKRTFLHTCTVPNFAARMPYLP